MCDFVSQTVQRVNLTLSLYLLSPPGLWCGAGRRRGMDRLESRPDELLGRSERDRVQGSALRHRREWLHRHCHRRRGHVRSMLLYGVKQDTAWSGRCLRCQR